MKLRQIGVTAPEVEGVLLMTHEEYERHPAYHPMCHFTMPALFVSQDGKEWRDVSRSLGSSYALLASNPQEREQLWEAGYRMVNLERPGAPQCRECNRGMPDDAHFFGKKMWHEIRPTCRHEEYVLCPECWGKAHVACSVCGCEVIYS